MTLSLPMLLLLLACGLGLYLYGIALVWRRDRIPAVFASPGYLGHWAQADAPGAAIHADAPVVHVNWYAASIRFTPKY